MEDLILFGDAVKALGNGKVGGYLVRFTDANKKDLTRQYFSIKTYLGPVNGDGAECLFEHGLSLKEDALLRGVKDKEILKMFDALADLTFAPIKTKRDKLGVWAETVLDIADGYQKMVYEMAEKGKLGWSSGSAGHRIKIASDGHIERWPIIEGSLTPRPCMPMDTSVMPMKAYREGYAEAIKSFFGFEVDEDEEPFTPTAKSLPADKSLSARLTRLIDDLVEEGQLKSVIVKKLALEALCDEEDIEDILSGKTVRPPDLHLKAFTRVLNVSLDQLKEIAGAPSQQTLKGMFADAYNRRQPDRWEVEKTLGKVLCEVAQVSVSSMATGTEFDRKAKVKEVISEYAPVLEAIINYQMDEHEKQAPERRGSFYLKSASDLKDVFENIEGVAFSEHSQLVVSAFKGISKRFDRYYQNRLKAGRVLSESTRKELIAFNEQILTAASGLQALLEKTQPMATSTEKNAALSEFMRTEYRLDQLGVTE